MPQSNENLRHVYRVWQLVKQTHSVYAFAERDWKMYGFQSPRAMRKALHQRIKKQQDIAERDEPKFTRATKGIRYRFREPEKIAVEKRVEVVKQVVKYVETPTKGIKLMKLKLKYGLKEA